MRSGEFGHSHLVVVRLVKFSPHHCGCGQPASTPVPHLSVQARAAEQADAFARARRAHSGVESAINGLEVHGPDRCPDHGIEGFKRYVARAVVARNTHRIGAILWQQEQEREKGKTRYADRDTTYKLAA